MELFCYTRARLVFAAYNWRLAVAFCVATALIISLSISTSKAANLQFDVSATISSQCSPDCDPVENEGSAAHHHGICACHAFISPSNTNSVLLIEERIFHFGFFKPLLVSFTIAPLLRPPLK